MAFLYLKALHIIFVVTWFSGMFYLVRLYIYQREAYDKSEPERSILLNQLGIMVKRLYWAITVPSAVLTLCFGISLLFYYGQWPLWLWIKIGFVAVLFVYQYTLHILYKQHANHQFKFTSQQLRIWNEIPTLILIAVVMLVVVKQALSLVYGLLGLLALMGLLMSAIRIYKNLRRS